MSSAEQQARDLLERMGIDDAQSFSAGDVVELANLIAGTGTTPHQSRPEYHYEQAKLLLDDIVAHKDDASFTEVAATLLTQASIAHSLQGLLAAKILDQQL